MQLIFSYTHHHHHLCTSPFDHIILSLSPKKKLQTLQYLVDADVVSTLRRLRSMLATPHGRLVLKENRPCKHTVGTEDDFQVDVPSGPHAR
jgi:hypothetical protein